MTAIHRIDPEIWVQTPKGEGHALFLLDYGIGINTIWLVHLLATGEVIHIDSSEVKIMGNPMYQIEHPKPFNREVPSHVSAANGRAREQATTREADRQD